VQQLVAALKERRGEVAWTTPRSKFLAAPFVASLIIAASTPTSACTWSSAA
jgi:hypothetical protein